MKIVRDKEGRIIQILKEEADGDVNITEIFKAEVDKEIAKEKEITAQQKNRCDFWKDSISNITSSIAEPPIMESSEEKQPRQRTEEPCSSAGLKFSESFMENFKKNENLNDPEFLKEAKKHFHNVFINELKRKYGEKYGDVNPNVIEQGEKSFEKLFEALIRIGKAISE